MPRDGGNETDESTMENEPDEQNITNDTIDSNPVTESWINVVCGGSQRGQPGAGGNCCNSEGYGEMAAASVEKMAQLLNLSGAAPTASFFDLGSGTGRLVMHMAAKGYARLATGVELNSARHAFAVELARSGAVPAGMPWASDTLGVSGGGSAGEREAQLSVGVQLFHGDMLAADVSMATVIYTNPACLSCETRLALLRKIVEECLVLGLVITTSPLPELVASGDFVQQQTELLSPMIGYEWQVPVTLYRRVARLGSTAAGSSGGGSEGGDVDLAGTTTTAPPGVSLAPALRR